MRPNVRIATRFQGPTGSGQGGWTAFRLAERIDVPVTVSIHAAIPLDTELDVSFDATSRTWALASESCAGDRTLIMTATPASETSVDGARTEPVTVEEATDARRRFAIDDGRHPVPWCFSCGIQPDSMCVHPAALEDGRFATDWTVPAWAVNDAGTVDGAAMWAALDCTAAWYVSRSGDERVALTVRFDAQILRPLHVGETYAIVGWSGHGDTGWEGRKRHAASAAFAADGTCVAMSTSFWVSVGI